MSERFYLPGDLAQPDLVLEGSEAHHLAHVLRLRAGQSVVLFDGRGAEVDATITAVSKREVRLEPGTVRQLTDVPGLRLTLAVAPPKGDRFRWLVEKATELGVERLIPLRTTRSVVDPRDAKLDKLRQTVIAACKQSGRARLMAIDETTDLESLRATRAAQAATASATLLLHPEAPPLREQLRGVEGELLLVIGPEGGFTPEELEQADSSGFPRGALGHTILRTETAALAGASIALHLCEPRNQARLSGEATA